MGSSLTNSVKSWLRAPNCISPTAAAETSVRARPRRWSSAARAVDNPNLDWTIPKQGGLRWAQLIGVVAGTTQTALAQKFVEYILSPEGQARLATASCYWGMPTNQKAGDILTAGQKAVLRWGQQPDYLKRSQLYPVPDAVTDQAMQDMWTAMLNR
jgi:spermidine/putrescine transport system substrate-binding protein